MTWVRLDDQFADHPKIAAAGPLAAWLYVCGLTYSSRYLTDGHIPAVHLPRLAAVPQPVALAERLVAVGLWERAEGGYRVHDYLRYQSSAAEVRAVRTRDADRKALGRANGAGRVRPDDDRTPHGIPKDSARNPPGVPADSIGSPEGVRPESFRPARVVPPSPPIHPPPPPTDTSPPGGEGGGDPPLPTPPVLRAGGDGDAVDPDAARTWTAALDALALHMSRGNFDMYFRDTRGLVVADGRLVVGVRNPLLTETIEQRFGALVRRTLADLAGAPPDVRLVVGP